MWIRKTEEKSDYMGEQTKGKLYGRGENGLGRLA